MRLFVVCMLVAGIAVLAGCPAPSGQDICNQTVSRARRCMTSSECQLMRGQAQCASEFQYLRPEYASALGNCNIDSLPCGTEGDTMLQTCAQNAITASMSAPAFRAFAQAICNACPSFGTFSMTMPTADQCFMNATAPLTRADGGALNTTSILAIYSFYNDAILNPITTCAQAITPGTMTSCMAANQCFQNSTLQMIFGDAGPTCPTTTDAATE